MTRPTCGLPGCGRPHHAQGFCRAHYRRWQRHGDPQVEIPVAARTAAGTGYWSSHRRVQAVRGPASAQRCTGCGAAAVVWSYDGTDPDERTDPTRWCRYSLDPTRYQPRCRSCHQRATAEGSAARSAVGLDIERAARLYRAGASVRGIGALLHVSPAAVRAALRAHGHATAHGPIRPTSHTDLDRSAATDGSTPSDHQPTANPNPTDIQAPPRSRPDHTTQDHQTRPKSNDQRSTARTKDNDTSNDQSQSGPLHHDPTVGSASPAGPAEPEE